MKQRIFAAVVTAALAVTAIGGGVALAGGDDEAEGPDVPITGAALEQASAAALAHLGGGEVTETEVGDEESYYEVEVTIDGRQVDVQLDEQFRVVGTEDDGVGDED